MEHVNSKKGFSTSKKRVKRPFFPPTPPKKKSIDFSQTEVSFVFQLSILSTPKNNPPQTLAGV